MKSFYHYNLLNTSFEIEISYLSHTVFSFESKVTSMLLFSAIAIIFLIYVLQVCLEQKELRQ